MHPFGLHTPRYLLAQLADCEVAASVRFSRARVSPMEEYAVIKNVVSWYNMETECETDLWGDSIFCMGQVRVN